MRSMTRRERRAQRQRRYEAVRLCQAISGGRSALRAMDGDRFLPGWLRPLDYKVSGETGAMRVPSKARTWHIGGRLNAHRPPAGQRWDRSGSTYVTGCDGAQFLRPIIHHRWRKLTEEQAPDNVVK